MLPDLSPGDRIPTSREWERLSQPRRYWVASYQSSRLDYFQAGGVLGGDLLPRHENESETRHRRRRESAIVRPLVRHLVDRYVDHVCRHGKHVVAEGKAAEFVGDATGLGKSLHTVTREALTCALVQGVAYGLVDNEAGGAYRSVAHAESAGARPIVRHVNPAQVLWERVWDGKVVAAIVSLEDRSGRPFLWAVDETESFRVELSGDPEAQSSWRVESVGERSAHGYGGCPLVRIEHGGATSPEAGPWCDAQQRFAVFESLLQEELYGVTFTTHVFSNVSPETLAGVTIGSGKGICLPPHETGASPSVQKLSADVSQAGSLRDQLIYEVAELYRSAGLLAGVATQVGQPESGVARAFAFNEIEARLASLAELAEGFELRLCALAASAFGFAPPEKIAWPREFAPLDLQAAVAAAGQLKINGAPQVLIAAAWEKIARQTLAIAPGSDDDAVLQEQLDALGGEGPYQSEGP